MKNYNELYDALRAGYTLAHKGGNDYMRLHAGSYQCRSEMEIDPTVWHDVDLAEIGEPNEWSIVDE